MGLVIQSRISEQGTGTSYKQWDKTGLYNNPDNLGGWNAPNTLLSSVTLSRMIVTKPDPITLLPAGTPVTLPFTSSIDTNAFTVVTPDQLGYVDKFPDGIYLFHRYIEISGGTSKFETYQYICFDRQVKCCLKNLDLKAKIQDGGGCSCSEAINSLIMDKILYSNALCAAKKCGDINDEVKYLKQLQYICDQAKCCI